MALKLGELIGYFVAKGKAYLESDKPLDYIVAKNGNMKVIRNGLGMFVKPTKEIPNLEEVKPGVYLDIPKVPFALFEQMVAWFKAVYQKDKTESTIMVFYNKEQKNWILWPPKQTNQGALSNYKRDEDPEYTQMCKDNVLVMVNHAHPWGATSVSPSGIDDKDEKEAMLYMVVSNVEGIPCTYVSSCPDGERMKLNFFDIFENPLDTLDMPKEYKDLLKDYMPEKEVFKRFFSLEGVTVPEEWWAQHSKYTTPVTKGTDYQWWKDRSGQQGKVSHINAGGRTSLSDAEEIEAERKARAYYSSAIGGSNNYWDGEWTEEEIDAYCEAYYLRNSDGVQKDGYTGANGNYIDDDTLADAYETEIDRIVCGQSRDYDDSAPLTSLGDIIDATLDLPEVKVAKLIYVLMEEGYDDIIEELLKERQAQGLTGKHTENPKVGKAQDGRTEGKTIIEGFNKAIDKTKEVVADAVATVASGLKAADEPKIKLTLDLTKKEPTPGLTLVKKN